jgi:hypothetical protein
MEKEMKRVLVVVALGTDRTDSRLELIGRHEAVAHNRISMPS